MPTTPIQINQLPSTKSTPAQGNDYLIIDNDQGSGTFDTKKAYVGTIAITPVNTISELRNMRVPTGSRRGRVRCLGYYAVGDGGGGPVRYWSGGMSAGTYVDNGGSVILPSGGDGSGAWLFEGGSVADVRWFGAVGDGATNDTDEIEASQAAFGDNVFYNGFFRCTNDQARYRMLNQDRALASLPGHIGQQTLTLNFPYIYTDTAIPSQSASYVIPNTRFIVENGKMFFKVTFRGYLNTLKFQWHDDAGLELDTWSYNILGVGTGSSSQGAAVSLDNLKKVVVFEVPKVFDGGYSCEDGRVRYLRISIQSNPADQALGQWALDKIEYTFFNDKNVRYRVTNQDFGKKIISMRNANNGVSSSGDTTFFMESDLATTWFKNMATEFQRDLNVDCVRFPIQYKYLYNNGTIRYDAIRRIVEFLNHLNGLGLTAIIALNHGFTDTSYRPTDWVNANNDLTTSGARTTYAANAITVIQHFVDHPTIRCVELENEVNYFMLAPYTSTNTMDYLTKLTNNVRSITAKPVSISFSGSLNCSMIFSKDLFDMLDYIDIHKYGSGYSNLPGHEIQIYMSESDPADWTSQMSRWENFSSTLGIWNQYVDPVYGASPSDILAVKSYIGNVTGPEIVPFWSMYTYDKSGLAQVVTPVPGDVVRLYSLALKYEYRNRSGTSGWEQFIDDQRRTTSPSSGTWEAGDRVYKSNPTYGSPTGWVCITAGTPGTWVPFGRVDNTGPDYGRVVLEKVYDNLPDNVATEVFNITTTNETGSNDGGAYSVFIRATIVNNAGATVTNTAAKSWVGSFSRALAADGATGVTSAVDVQLSGSSAATSSGTRDIGTITVTVTETSEYVVAVKFQVDSTGSSASPLDLMLEVVLLYRGFLTAPVVA